jgi:hypothetical protein
VQLVFADKKNTSFLVNMPIFAHTVTLATLCLVTVAHTCAVIMSSGGEPARVALAFSSASPSFERAYLASGTGSMPPLSARAGLLCGLAIMYVASVHMLCLDKLPSTVFGIQ